MKIAALSAILSSLLILGCTATYEAPQDTSAEQTISTMNGYMETMDRLMGTAERAERQGQEIITLFGKD